MVFPTIVKAGMGIGAEYGEGAMRSRGKTIGYCNMIAVSFGFQLGIPTRSVVIMCVTPEALSSFIRVDGFKIGDDGSVAIIAVGAIDTENITSPVVGFILGPAGLKYNLTLEGSHISRISR
jgi:lipid-binding SYLF domain-containing protein